MMARGIARLVLRPFRAFIALLFVTASLSYLGGAAQPPSVDTALPTAVRVMWGACLLLGGVALLAGLTSGTRRLEKSGLILLAGGAAVYAMSILAVTPARGALSAGLCLAVSGACLVDSSDRVQNWAQRTLYNALQRTT